MKSCGNNVYLSRRSGMPDLFNKNCIEDRIKHKIIEVDFTPTSSIKSKYVKSIALEKPVKNSEREVFYHIQEFCHIDFRELKIAIEDYGNINYLNTDF
jgi:hypothetical protein